MTEVELEEVNKKVKPTEKDFQFECNKCTFKFDVIQKSEHIQLGIDYCPQCGGDELIDKEKDGRKTKKIQR